jgi:hypothetical protein
MHESRNAQINKYIYVHPSQPDVCPKFPRRFSEATFGVGLGVV